MVNQFLLRPDGSIPEGTNVAALEAAGIRLVRPNTPTTRPTPGMHWVETDPVQISGVWQQQWVEVPIPPPRVLSASEAETMRLDAYRQEADPLFFKVERGEATRADWLNKVAEIRARYPKP